MFERYSICAIQRNDCQGTAAVLMDKWLKNFLLLVFTLAVTSYLLISWAQSQMPLVQTEKLDTESMSEARQFQRDCFERNDAVLSVVIYEHAQAWRLTCQWEEQL